MSSSSCFKIQSTSQISHMLNTKKLLMAKRQEMSYYPLSFCFILAFIIYLISSLIQFKEQTSVRNFSRLAPTSYISISLGFSSKRLDSMLKFDILLNCLLSYPFFLGLVTMIKELLTVSIFSLRYTLIKIFRNKALNLELSLQFRYLFRICQLTWFLNKSICF